jgi:sugar lactone lactonase YvrE
VILLALSGSSPLFAQPAASQPAVRFVTQVAEDAQANLKLDWVNHMEVAGNFLLETSHRDGRVNVFSRDPKTGEIKFLNFVDLAADLKKAGTHLDAYPVLAKQNIMYITGAWTHANSNAHSLGLNWYRFDPKDGSTRRAGSIPCDAGSLIGSPDGKSFYLAAWFTKAIYPITVDAETGAPRIGEKLVGKGLSGGLVYSSDRKQLYSCDGQSVAWVQVKADGSLEYGGSADLAALEPPNGLRSIGVGVSPDGHHVYVSLWTYKYSALGLFSRDSATGKLTFVEKLAIDPNMVGINTMVFTADGATGYYSSSPENSGSCLGWFTRDAKTGRLTFGGVADKSKIGPNHLAYDEASGTIYLAGNWNTKYFNIYKTK